MRQKLKYQDVQDFVCGFCYRVGRIVNYVTTVAAKSTSKKTSEIGILINASSLTLCIEARLQIICHFDRREKSWIYEYNRSIRIFPFDRNDNTPDLHIDIGML